MKETNYKNTKMYLSKELNVSNHNIMLSKLIFNLKVPTSPDLITQFNNKL